MRIAIYSDNFFPELSGIADSILRTGKELAHRGHAICFVAPSYSTKNFKRVGLEKKELSLGENVQVIRIPSIPYPTGSKQGRFVLPLGKSIFGIRRFRPDIIHVNLPFGTGLEGFYAAKFLRIPVIGTNHTPMGEFMRYSPLKGALATKVIVAYNTWFYGICDYVTSPAKTIFDEMIANGFSKPHQVLSNPIDTETFKPMSRRETLRKKYGLGSFVVLYAGRIAQEKSIDLLLYAIKALIPKIPTITLLIVGQGAYEPTLRAIAKSLGISEHIKFMGFISQGEIFRELYNAAHVFAIMSTAETQSIVAMQAMACGVPVIAARAWGLGEYIAPSRGILVPPGNVKELSNAIEMLSKQPKKQAILGKHGRAFVKKLSPQAIAEAWEAIYKKTINKYDVGT